MGSKTKHNTKSFKDSSIVEANFGPASVTSGKIDTDAVTSAKINDGDVTAGKLASTLDVSSKTVTLGTGAVTAGNLASTLDLSSKTLTLPNSTLNRQFYNIGLLGFKMAVNESLTVFNLIDGVVDEFNDESGTDEAEGSNDLYNSGSDYYINSTQPDGQSLSFSAGFTTTSITEPDTSITGTNPTSGSGTFGQFTVPSGVTSINAFVYGAAGENSSEPGGGGGYTTGTIAVSSSQVLEIVVGEGGQGPGSTLGGGGPMNCGISASGGGLSGVFTNCEGFPALQNNAAKAPQVFLVGGGGGGSGHSSPSDAGGAGGGLIGCAGGSQSEQTSPNNPGTGPMASPAYADGGGGGGQSSAGSPAPSPLGTPSSGGFLKGASGAYNPQNHGGGSGGGGFYGGGGGARQSPGYPGGGGGGGGSSYYGHPQITGGSTEEGAVGQSGGIATPNYVVGTGEANAEDGYVLITASLPATATSTTIVSQPFTSTSVATNARIVVFEENIDTPTLNTDIIASISRDGTNFTTATLSDSGYVTGSSGQRILTGQADISGQPSGQSMRWKLQLANNQVKIHGVSLSWA